VYLQKYFSTLTLEMSGVDLSSVYQNATWNEKQPIEVELESHLFTSDQSESKEEVMHIVRKVDVDYYKKVTPSMVKTDFLNLTVSDDVPLQYVASDPYKRQMLHITLENKLNYTLGLTVVEIPIPSCLDIIDSQLRYLKQTNQISSYLWNSDTHLLKVFWTMLSPREAKKIAI
jgi:hypothetical protein